MAFPVTEGDRLRIAVDIENTWFTSLIHSLTNIIERFGQYTIKSDITELDVKYPHTCFECGKKLQYKHAEKQAEYKGMNMKEFDKLWESENVEFYCCSCYGKEVK